MLTWKEDFPPTEVAQWYKQQSDDQIRVLKEHDVWYPGGPPRPPVIEARSAPVGREKLSRRMPGEAARRVIRECADFVDISVDLMKSTSRVRDVSYARMAAAFLLKEHCDLSLTAIGRKLGGRDHSTVASAYKKVIEDLSSGGERFGEIVSFVETRLSTGPVDSGY